MEEVQQPIAPPQDDFLVWWKTIAFEDQESFRLHGGDETLARFVFTLDRAWNGRGGKSLKPYDLLRAWVQASGDEEAFAAEEARKAWDSDAVQDLVYRLSRRSMRAARDRLLLKYTAVLERMLDAADRDDSQLKERLAATEATAKFVDLADRNERQDREMRMRRAFAKAVERQKELQAPEDIPTKESLEAFVKTLAKHFGSEEIKRLLPGE